MKKYDSILTTIKILSASDKPLSTNQLARRTNLAHRTIQRHIARLNSADMVGVAMNAHYTSEKLYEKKF